MSDKKIVEQSNLINYLLPGDVIIADGGSHVMIMPIWYMLK